MKNAALHDQNVYDAYLHVILFTIPKASGNVVTHDEYGEAQLSKGLVSPLEKKANAEILRIKTQNDMSRYRADSSLGLIQFP